MSGELVLGLIVFGSVARSREWAGSLQFWALEGMGEYRAYGLALWSLATWLKCDYRSMIDELCMLVAIAGRRSTDLN